ncbi:hypothetical protein PR003_g9897 [Phytophthora rubi]|uniref:Uncharacterized protein n=1 Tax=Phytophthora rubi TaxID=129364 RepID=A0A6A4F7E3_9STRA|nr:hypothetical protein PR001_g11234 [Phytophthora rubi]KAE9039969.1 hypothetical protein PR002_g5199 [Phytophthora rubi]KAE9341622.1 hypothetical protein PR003_g9897 [Phytophthora rubi]
MAGRPRPALRDMAITFTVALLPCFRTNGITAVGMSSKSTSAGSQKISSASSPRQCTVIS